MNVGTTVLRAARRFGTKPCVIDGDRIASFIEVDQRSARLASHLVGQGLGPGDRVAIVEPNCLEWYDATLAALRAGLVRVFVNPRLAPREVEHLLADSEARVAIVHPSLVDAVEQVRPRSLEALVVTDERLELTLLASTPRPVDVELDDGAPCALQYTSGTTGLPKGAVLTHGNQAAWLGAAFADFDVALDEVFLHAGPLMHMSGGLVLPNLYRGGTQVVMPKFDPSTFLQLVEQHAVTATALVPTMLYMVLDELAARPVPEGALRSLRTIIYGGSPIAPDRLRQAIEQFGAIFLGSYGLVEAGGSTVLGKEQHTVGSHRLSSAGAPSFGTSITIVDDHGAPVPANSPGRVRIAGRHVAAGYWGRSAGEGDLADGSVLTSDVGYLDEEGFLFLIDRAGDMIVSGGFNVYPREVEDVLMAHAAVAEAAVIPVPHERWGESVKAIVRLRAPGSATEDDLDHWCRQHLASYKVPRSYALTEDDLPKNASGKIDRKALKELEWQGRERAVN